MIRFLKYILQREFYGSNKYIINVILHFAHEYKKKHLNIKILFKKL